LIFKSLTEDCTSSKDGSASLPGDAGGVPEGLHQGLFRGEPAGERPQREVAFAHGEQAFPQARGAPDGPLEAREVDDVDPDPRDGHGGPIRP